MLKPSNRDISKRILLVAYPIILSNISRALMGIVDMIMVGRLVFYLNPKPYYSCFHA